MSVIENTVIFLKCCTLGGQTTIFLVTCISRYGKKNTELGFRDLDYDINSGNNICN